jgi:integrase
MARLYTRKKSPYWNYRFPGADEKEIRGSTKVPLGNEHKETAQIRASEIEFNYWNSYRRGGISKPQYTYEDLMVNWIEECKPGTADISSVKQLNDVFSGTVLSDLTGKDIAEVKKLWRGQKLKDSTIARRLKTFSAAINYARKEWEWDIVNVVKDRIPRAEDFEAPHLTEAQAQKFVEALKKRRLQPYNAPHLYDFFILALMTGFRKCELLSCRWDQVDFEYKCIHLNKGDQKSRKRTSTALNVEAMRALERRKEYVNMHYPDSKWVFPNARSNGKLHIKDIKTAWHTVRAEIGLPNIRIHDLRHTFASWLVQKGHSLYGVSKALRHSSMKPTERYAHLDIEHQRETMSIIGNSNVNFDLEETSIETSSKDQWQASLRRENKAFKSASAHNPHIDLTA